MNKHIFDEYDRETSRQIRSDENVCILAVGDLELWRRSCGEVPRSRDLQFLTIEELSDGLLNDLRPDIVVSPLVSPRFDCIDLAHILDGYNYPGAYRAIARNLPDYAMIVREVRASFPKLDFDVISIFDSPSEVH